MKFRHHPDGKIYIEDYSCSLEDFISEVPNYDLPKPYIGREYISDLRHSIYDNQGNQYGAEFPWDLGNEIFSKFELIKQNIDKKNAPPAPTFEESKAKKIKQIDMMTNKLINKGVVFNNANFSMSFQAQLNWTNLYQSRLLLPYPVAVTTLDDKEYTFNNATEIANFYLVGLTQAQTILGVGRKLKIRVLDAKNQEELDEIKDG